MINFRLLRNSDMHLWVCMFALIAIGFLSIYSSTFAMLSRKAAMFPEAGIDPLMFVKRHFFTFLFGSVVMSVLMYIDYGHLRSLYKLLYGVMIFLLLLVMVVGYESFGAQRWINLGPFSFQPSEISKLLLIIVLAKVLENSKDFKKIGDMVPAFVFTLLPFLFVFKQPDLGTSLVFVAIMAGMLIWAQDNIFILLLLSTPLLSALFSLSTPLWIFYLAVLGVSLYFSRAKAWDLTVLMGLNTIVGLILPVAWHLLKEYQKKRLLIFLDPTVDPFGAGYHTIQSKIAIGAGGMFGTGFLKGTQTQLQFIPQQWTDFIFSMIGEEFGMIGAVLVIALFGVLIWRAVVIAVNANDFFGSMLASGIAAMFTFHMAVNIAMTLGMAPVVGIPLPFISYGGTSLIVSMASVGILQSISMRKVKLFF